MPDPYQKTVRLSPNGSYLATGGDDGFLRVWTMPDVFRTREIEAHTKEIDDLDFSPDNTKVGWLFRSKKELKIMLKKSPRS